MSRTLLVLALVVASIPTVRAQSEDESSAAEADLARAVVLFEESEGLYNAGRFAEAAVMLRRAYALRPDPTLLFNLARALEGDGDLDGAIAAYEQYLAEAGDVRDRGAVEARVQTLRTQRDALAAAEPSDDEPRNPPPEVLAPEPAPASPSVGPWILIAGGVAAGGAGLGLGLRARGLADDADDAPNMRDAVREHDRAKRFALVANVMMAAGGAAAAAGLVWVLVRDGGDDDSSVAIVPSGVGLALRGRF